MSNTPKGIDWAAINQRLYDYNQQLLRDNAGLLKGPAAQAMWPDKEDKKEKADE